MRIRRIELSGFKSFMDRTTIELPDGVTAIVGPNGCGKSNIVDAIRWVLGEQSPKHLRGASMEDVIFAGNAQQGPLGMAEVSLLLERSEEDLLRARTDEEEIASQEASGLPPELAHASEVLVTRRYFRSGESEYYINRAACRLRDITELFLGTGVGTKAYAIIEQGRVEQLVSAKPDELRLFIEEAAGTTRYRARKVSAERKMARTRENLVRVQDILREQQRQISSLERQAKRAEEYHRLKGELRALDLRVATSQYETLVRRRHALACRLGCVRSEGRRLEAEVADLRSATTEARRARVEVEGRLREVEEARTTAQIAVADGTARAESLEMRCAEVERRAAHAAATREACVTAAEGLRQELAEVEAGLAQAEATSVEAEAQEARAVQSLQAVHESGAALDRAVEDAKEALVAAIGEETRLRNMNEALRSRREELTGRQRRLEEEQSVLGERLDANQRARDEVHVRATAVAERERELQSEQAMVADQHPAAVARVDAELSRVEDLRRVSTHIESRISSLEELQSRLEGCTRGTASLIAKGEGVRGVLADVLRVPEQLERAVAVALSGRLGDVVVEGTGDAVAAVAWLVETSGGSARALPREPERRPTVIVPSGRRLLDEIEVDPEHWSLLEGLLGHVLLADDLPGALALWRSASHPVTVVTPSGEAVDQLGAISGGSEPPLEETLLSRRRELRVLHEDLSQAEANLASGVRDLAMARAALATSEETLQRLSERRQRLGLERVAAEKDRDRLDEERARLAAELEVSALEVSGLIGAGGELSSELEAAQASHRDAARAVSLRRETLDTATQAVAAWRTDVARHEEARTEAAVVRAASAERIRTAAALLSQKRQVVAETAAKIQEQETAAREAETTRERLTVELRVAREATARAQEQIEILDVERAGLAETLTTLRATAEIDDRREEEVRDRLDRLRERRGEWEVQLTEARLQIEAVRDRLQERYDVGLEALSLGGRASQLDAGDFERVETLRTRLVRLGDVNPAAVEELQEIRARHDFTQSQRNDLEQSLSDLEHTIETLNKTCRVRFRETFDAANEKLADVFPQLFPGGKARLELVTPGEDAEDDGQQEAGVEIVVQPAGKKLQSLNLLSGGEKALTATALVFSLFLIRPTPFCLLDEVDAPLDEANIGRFNHMVRTMAATSQFVVVTHNRRTMERANTLYGITMEQAGVSKVVSVRLNEAA